MPMGLATRDSSSTVVAGTLRSTPNTTFRIELFASVGCDPTGFGEGERFLGTIEVSTDASATGTIRGDDRYSLFLPLVGGQNLPDLLVSAVRTTSNGLEVVITNQSACSSTTPCWVDLDNDPHTPPTGANQTWPYRGSQGVVWGGTQPLGRGEVLTLRCGGAFYHTAESHVAGTIAAGTPLYVQVDSANVEGDAGAVLEPHEASGGAYNNGLGPVGATTDVLLPAEPASPRAEKAAALAGWVRPPPGRSGGRSGGGSWQQSTPSVVGPQEGLLALLLSGAIRAAGAGSALRLLPQRASRCGVR